jgi:hypothetical protein
LDLFFDSHLIGHVQLGNIKLAPYETYPHEVNVLYAPQSPEAQLAGGRMLGGFASGAKDLTVDVGIADAASLIRSLAIPEVMRKALWDMLQKSSNANSSMSTHPSGPNQSTEDVPSPASSSSSSSTAASTSLRERLDAALKATLVTRPLPPLSPYISSNGLDTTTIQGMITQCRFKLLGKPPSLSLTRKAHPLAIAWVTLRNPFDVDVTVLRIVGRAERKGRVIGLVDQTFAKPAMMGPGDMKLFPKRSISQISVSMETTPSISERESVVSGSLSVSTTRDEERSGSVYGGGTREPWVIPFTTLNPKITVVSPPIAVDSSLDFKSFGDFFKAVRRKLEVDIVAQMEVMIGK